MNRRRALRSAKSQAYPVNRRPALATSLSTRLPVRSKAALTPMISAPASDNARARARPIPLLQPVTSAVSPSRPNLPRITIGSGPVRSIEAELVGGVEQGDDVFRRHAGLDVVDVVEHVAAAGLPGLEVLRTCSRTSPARRSAARAGRRSPRPRNGAGRRTAPSAPPGPCPPALICTGLRMSMPLSSRSGM